MTTTATVGYGDVVPRTTTGRGLAAVLMVTGIGLFGVIASTLSSAIMRVRGADDAEEAMRALLRQHRDLVVRHSRGELSEDELERATADLLKIRGR
jgi:voltage-gated potassium channel